MQDLIFQIKVLDQIKASRQLKIILKNDIMKLFKIVFTTLLGIIILISFMFFIVMKSKGPINYSNDKKEALKNDSYICSYYLIKEDNKIISRGVLVYGIKEGLFFDKKVKDKKQLSTDISSLGTIFKEKNTYWEAFFLNKKLVAFEKKGKVFIIGVNERMDTILITPNKKKDIFYLIKE